MQEVPVTNAKKAGQCPCPASHLLKIPPLPPSALLPDVYTAQKQLLRERWEQGFNKHGRL